MSTASIAAIRFGYGLSPYLPAPADGSAILTALAGPDTAAMRHPIAGFFSLMPQMKDFIEARRAEQKGEPGAEERFKTHRRFLRRTMLDGLRAQMMRAVLSPDGFRERLQFFWADHFTVRSKRPAFVAGPAGFGEDAIRPHLTGSFRDMLRAAATHPVMLAFLDQNGSIGPASTAGQRREVGLNENLAREILELHTLGVNGGYTQQDVTQFAELLTGLSFNTKVGFRFRPAWAEPGAEIVLGQSYGGAQTATLDEVFTALDDIAVHPATAAHIARKLAVNFISDTPDPGLVADLTNTFRATDGNLMALYQILLGHPAAWEPKKHKARQPWDFMAASFRALGLQEAQFTGLSYPDIRQGLRKPLASMGQPYAQPPGPDGWPEEAEAWITPPALAERIAWAMELTAGNGPALPDPRDFVEIALGDTASETLIRAVRGAASRETGAGLVLASAEFNRR